MKKISKVAMLMPWFICALGALFYSYEYFLRITPSVMTQELRHFYHIKDGTLGSLSAYYYYIYTPMQLIVGVLMDRYGPRRLLTIATLSCVAGSMLFASTPYLHVAEAGRLLIGFGSAFAYVGVLKLATVWLPRRYFAMFAGFAAALGMFGAILGDNLMTAMKALVGWQETVMISAFCGVILALLIGIFVRDHAEFDRKSKMTVNQVSFSEAFQGIFQILKAPQFWVVGAVGALLYLPASVFAELWGIPYLEHSLHFGSLEAASAVSMVFLGFGIGGPIYGWISDNIRRRSAPLTFASIATAISISLLLFVGPHVPAFMVYILLFVFGMTASGQVIVFAVGKELGQERLAGSSLAFTNCAVMIGGMVLQPVLGYVLQYTNQDFHFALMSLPIAFVISAFLAKFFLKETFCKSKEQVAWARENQAAEVAAS